MTATMNATARFPCPKSLVSNPLLQLDYCGPGISFRRVGSTCRLALASCALAAGVLVQIASPAFATPTCPGADRTLCGGRIIPERRNPLNRFLIWLYRPIIKTVLKAKTLTIGLAIAALALTLWPARQLGTDCLAQTDERLFGDAGLTKGDASL